MAHKIAAATAIAVALGLYFIYDLKFLFAAGIAAIGMAAFESVHEYIKNRKR
jgi:hypothetical protein